MMSIAHDWRLKGQRYRLEGQRCPHCGYKSFPPRAICPECKRSATAPAVSEKEKVYKLLFTAPAEKIA